MYDCHNRDSFPAAFISFYYGEDYEDAVRHAIALGGDADTLAAIAGPVRNLLGISGTLPIQRRKR